MEETIGGLVDRAASRIADAIDCLHRATGPSFIDSEDYDSSYIGKLMEFDLKLRGLLADMSK